MDNGLDNMLDMYLFETNTLLEQLDELLMDAENADCFSADQINEIFRIMHTIKGSSAMMQFNSLMTVAHRIEDMFFVIRENGAVEEQYSQRLFNLMFKSSDFLKAQISLIEGGQQTDESADDIVGEIEHLLAVMKGQAEDQPVAAQAKTTAAAPTDQIAAASDKAHVNLDLSVKLYFDQGSGMESLRALMLLKNIAEVCVDEIVTTPSGIEATTEITQELIENGLLITFGCDQDFVNGLEIIKQDIYVDNYELLVTDNKASLNDAVIPVETKEAQLMEEKVLTPTVSENSNETKDAKKGKDEKVDSAKQPTTNTNSNNKTNLINVNLSKLDSLMALVGELVITQSMVTSSSDLKDLKLDNFTKDARQLRKLTTELQDIVMSVRMVPVAGVFQKMHRIVRDMSHTLGKDVQLVTVGNDTEIDKTIVDSIQDPLMHIVRNSMDHGIEPDVKDRDRKSVV